MFKFKKTDGKTLVDKQPITCTKGCKKNFLVSELKPITRMVDEKLGVTEVYFKCPKCGYKYSCYFEDNQCRIWQDMKKKSSDLKFIEKLQTRINERMALLKEKYGAE